jgi:hypothetical protein
MGLRADRGMAGLLEPCLCCTIVHNTPSAEPSRDVLLAVRRPERQLVRLGRRLEKLASLSR